MRAVSCCHCSKLSGEMCLFVNLSVSSYLHTYPVYVLLQHFSCLFEQRINLYTRAEYVFADQVKYSHHSSLVGGGVYDGERRWTRPGCV